MSYVRVFVLMMYLVLVSYGYKEENHDSQQETKVFNVNDYGAVSDGKTNNSKSFLRAWEEACQWEGRATILIPNGKYMVDALLFKGARCKMSSILFYIDGVLTPPDSVWDADKWITFRYVNGLTIDGAGTLDAQGHKVWSLNKCDKDPNCPGLPASLRLEFVNESRLTNIRSINSRNTHISLLACNYMDISGITLSAPENSPNTDGIKIAGSTYVKVSNIKIGTGDDCVSVISGSRNVDVSNIDCGPGHGISVGSMGKFDNQNDTVIGLTVRHSTFRGTLNGVRIKTWGSDGQGLASNFTFHDLYMNNVGNPIIIDQQYCPHPPCTQIPSRIQVKDVRFDNIWGSSNSRVAVTLRCSKDFPCKNIIMSNINLSYGRFGGLATSECSNVIGNSYGHQAPPSCL